jgi:hypothetical protein
MNSLNNEMLLDYLEKCEVWHSSSLMRLTESQQVEYIRSYNFFTATKLQYQSFLEDSEIFEKKRSRIKINAFLAVLFLILLIGFFDSFSGLGEKFIVVSFVIIFFVEELFRRIEDRISRSVILQIERDFHSINIALKDVFGAIAKEKQLERFYEEKNSLFDDTQNYGIESTLNQFGFRKSILNQITSGATEKDFPIFR